MSIHQGLVINNPKRGFSVMPLTVEDLEDLTYLRVRLETMVLRDGIECGGIESEVPPRPPEAAAAAPASSWLTNAHRDSAELYRGWSRAIARDVGAEHDQITRLALDRDAASNDCY